jgi:hypothetical protein
MYNWQDVSKKISLVYDKVIDNRPKNLLERFKIAYSCGRISGIIATIYMLLLILFYLIIAWFRPAEQIEPAINFNSK